MVTASIQNSGVLTERLFERPDVLALVEKKGPRRTGRSRLRSFLMRFFQQNSLGSFDIVTVDEILVA